MVLKIRYEGDDDTETVLLGSREEGVRGDLEVVSPNSPLGAALIGAHVGDTREYQLPDGGSMKVALVVRGAVPRPDGRRAALRSDRSPSRCPLHRPRAPGRPAAGGRTSSAQCSGRASPWTGARRPRPSGRATDVRECATSSTFRRASPTSVSSPRQRAGAVAERAPAA